MLCRDDVNDGGAAREFSLATLPLHAHPLIFWAFIEDVSCDRREIIGRPIKLHRN